MTAVVGLDLSLTATGMVREDGKGLTIKTNPKHGDQRLEVIHDAIVHNLGIASLAVLEDLPYSARQAGVTGMVQGVARLALLRYGVRYAFLSPATLKKFATGNGRADKPMMAAALIDFFGDRYVGALTGTAQIIGGINLTDDNQVDAAWLRLAGRTWLGLEPDLLDRRPVLETGKWKDFS